MDDTWRKTVAVVTVDHKLRQGFMNIAPTYFIQRHLVESNLGEFEHVCRSLTNTVADHGAPCAHLTVRSKLAKTPLRRRHHIQSLDTHSLQHTQHPRLHSAALTNDVQK